jgi:hypothetical protein
MQRASSGAPCMAGLMTRDCGFNDLSIFMEQDQEKF